MHKRNYQDNRKNATSHLRRRKRQQKRAYKVPADFVPVEVPPQQTP